MNEYAYECARDAVDAVLFNDSDLLDCYNSLRTDNAWSLIVDIQTKLEKNVAPKNMVDHLENNLSEDVDTAREAILDGYINEVIGERYYSVTVQHDGEDVDCFLSYGTLETITGTLEASFDDGSFKGIDVNELTAVLTLDDYDVATMPHLSSPYYEITASASDLVALHDELAA
jgi:hypothetical protein